MQDCSLFWITFSKIPAKEQPSGNFFFFFKRTVNKSADPILSFKFYTQCIVLYGWHIKNVPTVTESGKHGHLS